MKIAFFTDNYLPQASGVATSVDYFAKALRKSGHTVYIFAPKIAGFKDIEDYIFRLPSIRVIPNLPDGARIPLPNKSILKMISIDFDIIHAHGNGAFSLLGLGIGRARKVPYVSTFHIQVDNFAHYFFKGRIIKPKMMNKLFLKKIADYCDGVIAPSEKMQSQLIEAGVTKEIEVIPNFVDIGKFKGIQKGFLRKKCKIPSFSPILLSCGRVGKEKNFIFLVRVFEKIAKENSKTHLVIVGPDWGEMEKLKRLGKSLRLKNRIHFVGEINNVDMPKVYKDANIFLFASKSEVHPMVAIEAASSGLPLIVVKDQAYKGIVVNGKNGYSLPLDLEIFAESIISLLKDTKKMDEFSKNSPLIVKENFDSEKLIRKLLKFYRKILNNYHPSKAEKMADYYASRMTI